MDEDRIKGAATNLQGKVKSTVGSLTGDSKTEADGKTDEIGGKLQNAYGSAKEAISDQAGTLGTQLDGFMKERPMMALLAAAGVGYVLAFLTHSSRR